MLTTSLLALACLISEKPPADQADLMSRLSEQEAAQVQSIVESDACLPENMEKLIQTTHDEMSKDEMLNVIGGHSPSEGCR